MERGEKPVDWIIIINNGNFKIFGRDFVEIPKTIQIVGVFKAVAASVSDIQSLIAKASKNRTKNETDMVNHLHIFCSIIWWWVTLSEQIFWGEW